MAPCFGLPNPNATCNLVANRFQADFAKRTLADDLSKNLDNRPWEGDFNRTGPTRNETFGSFIKGDVALPWDLQLTTHSGYDHYNRTISLDLDQSPMELFEVETDDNAYQVYQDANFSRELFGETFPVLVDVGGWGLHEDLDAKVFNFLGVASVNGVPKRKYHQQDFSAGLYRSFSFDFWNTSRSTAASDATMTGRSWTWASTSATSVQPPISPSDTLSFTDEWDSETGTIRPDVPHRDDTHVFWKYTRGWKPGTYNATASQFLGPTVANRKIDSFEAG
jgi:hypothetical protein